MFYDTITHEVYIMSETRRNLRIELMQQLYHYDLYQSDKLPFIPTFEHEGVFESYEKVIGLLPKIDHIIEDNLYEYKLYRLAFVDRAIIRLAVFEMLQKDTPVQIIINEAVELTKIYSNLDDQKQHKFTNKVLDNIAKSLKE